MTKVGRELLAKYFTSRFLQVVAVGGGVRRGAVIEVRNGETGRQPAHLRIKPGLVALLQGQHPRAYGQAHQHHAAMQLQEFDGLAQSGEAAGREVLGGGQLLVVEQLAGGAGAHLRAVEADVDFQPAVGVQALGGGGIVERQAVERLCLVAGEVDQVGALADFAQLADEGLGFRKLRNGDAISPANSRQRPRVDGHNEQPVSDFGPQLAPDAGQVGRAVG